ncbi:hypothetical protein EI94DRAFT_1787158 [Lactarius quietus]|nr:hypothetical protein EI94DRAFT_1787158 [Lactarius quietus]
MSRNVKPHPEVDITEAASSKVFSSGRTVGLAVGNLSQEEHSDECSTNRDAGKPPLGVKITVYKLFNMTAMLSFVLAKGILTFKGQITVPTISDLVLGGLLGVMLYWIGLPKRQNAKRWGWFFKFDLAPAIGYGTKRAIGSFLWSLLWADSVLFAIVVSCSMGIWANYLLDQSGVDFPLVAILAMKFGNIVFTASLFLGIRELTRRALAAVWVRQDVVPFINNYKSQAPLVERYKWFGTVGTIVGLICWIALLKLPMVMFPQVFE